MDDPATVVIDVRTSEEINATGPLSATAYALPLDEILQGAFSKSAEDFEDDYGFPKPMHDATMVFTCAAGARSDVAARVASAAGFQRPVNYVGGATEWFSKPPNT